MTMSLASRRTVLASAALAVLLLAAWATPKVLRRLDMQGMKPVTVAKGLAFPWSLAFLPDGRMLVTERPGRLRIVESDGTLGPPIAGLPPVGEGGEGGLLDDKLAQLDRVFGGRVSTTVLDFLKVISKHGRLDLLRAIQQEVARLYEDASGQVRVEVRTASPLDSNLAAKLAGSLQARLGATPSSRLLMSRLFASK